MVNNNDSDMNKNRLRVLNALLLLLRPIARVMLRNNIDFRQFTEAAKLAFVDVGTRDYGIRERPTNISRVAVMTRLTRKEVRRIRDLLDSKDHFADLRTGICEKVVAGWQTDEDFLTASGRPRSLPFDGEKYPFQELARRYAPDVPDGAVRTEMLRIGAMEKTKAGKYKLMGSPTITGDDAIQLEQMLDLLTAAASNVAHNLIVSKADQWPAEKVVGIRVRRGDEPKFRRISRKNIEKLKKEWANIAETYETLRDDNAGQLDQTPGLVMFHFEKENPGK